MKRLLLFFIILFLNAVFGCDQSSSGDSKPSMPEVAQEQSNSQTPRHGTKQALAIAEAIIPDQPVSGQVMGKSFHPDGIDISAIGNLELWTGDRNFSRVKLTINLPIGFGKPPAGQTFDFRPDKEGGFRPVIQIILKSDSGEHIFKSFQNQYRLKIEFDQAAEHRIPGRLYLHMPGEKMKIAGVFHVATPENPDQPPQERHRPYIHGRISFSPPERRMLMAGYAGMGDDGEVYQNGAGLGLAPGDTGGGGYAQSTTFKPRTTSIWRDKEGFLHFRHVRLSPGNYIFSIRWGDDLIAHQWQRVGNEAALRWDFEIDLVESGSLFVEVPDLNEGERVWLLPLNAYRVLPEGIDNRHLWKLPFHLQIKPEYKKDSVLFKLLPPGSYLVLYNDYRQKVTVTAGKRTKTVFQ